MRVWAVRVVVPVHPSARRPLPRSLPRFVPRAAWRRLPCNAAPRPPSPCSTCSHRRCHRRRRDSQMSLRASGRRRRRRRPAGPSATTTWVAALVLLLSLLLLLLFLLLLLLVTAVLSKHISRRVLTEAVEEEGRCLPSCWSAVSAYLSIYDTNMAGPERGSSGGGEVPAPAHTLGA